MQSRSPRIKFITATAASLVIGFNIATPASANPGNGNALGNLIGGVNLGRGGGNDGGGNGGGHGAAPATPVSMPSSQLAGNGNLNVGNLVGGALGITNSIPLSLPALTPIITQSTPVIPSLPAVTPVSNIGGLPAGLVNGIGSGAALPSAVMNQPGSGAAALSGALPSAARNFIQTVPSNLASTLPTSNVPATGSILHSLSHTLAPFLPVLFVPTASLVPVDVTRTRNVEIEEHYDGLQLIRLDPTLTSAGTAWIVTSLKSQPYSFADDNETIFVASPGSVFATAGPHTLLLREGCLVVASGNRQVTVKTALGPVVIPANSSAGVQQDRFGIVTVATLQGNESYMTRARNGEEVKVSFNSDEEVSLSSSSVASAEDTTLTAGQRDTLRTTGLRLSKTKLNPNSSTFARNLQCTDDSGATISMQERLSDLIRSHRNNSGKPEPDCRAEAPTAMAVHINPVSYSTSCNPGSSRLVTASKTLENSSGRVVAKGGSLLVELPNNQFNLERGDALVQATKPMVVGCGKYEVHLAKGSIALIGIDQKILKIRNLYESTTGGIEVIANGKGVKITSGQEIVISSKKDAVMNELKRDRVARRRMQVFEVANDAQAALNDFSIVSLFYQNELVKQIIKSGNKDDRAAAAKVVKMAACLMHVTGGRGAYQQLASK